MDRCRFNRKTAPLEVRTIKYKHKILTPRLLMYKHLVAILIRRIQSLKFKIQVRKSLNMCQTLRARSPLLSFRETGRSPVTCRGITILLEQRRKTVKMTINSQTRTRANWWPSNKVREVKIKTDRQALNPQITIWYLPRRICKEVAIWIVPSRKLVNHLASMAAKASQVALALLVLIKSSPHLPSRKQTPPRSKHRFVSCSLAHDRIQEACTIQNYSMW